MDGELQHAGWVKMPEMLPEDVGTFLVKIKVEASIRRQTFTFPEIFFLVKPPYNVT